ERLGADRADQVGAGAVDDVLGGVVGGGDDRGQVPAVALDVPDDAGAHAAWRELPGPVHDPFRAAGQVAVDDAARQAQHALQAAAVDADLPGLGEVGHRSALRQGDQGAYLGTDAAALRSLGDLRADQVVGDVPLFVHVAQFQGDGAEGLVGVAGDLLCGGVEGGR